MPDLSPPEHVADRRDRRRIAAIVNANPCAHCLNRDPEVMAWGKSVCSGHAKRSFPLCLNDGRTPAFEIDDTTFNGSM